MFVAHESQRNEWYNVPSMLVAYHRYLKSHLGGMDPWTPEGHHKVGLEGLTSNDADSSSEGVAADRLGNIYGAEVGPRQLVKYVREN